MQKIKGALFDLDGVIVDTAKYHFMAWKRLAESLGFAFTEKDNEALKGVSRKRSLEILLEVGSRSKGELSFSGNQKEEMATMKNTWYVEYLNLLDERAFLPGAKDYLLFLRERKTAIALGSASKNARMILRKLNVEHLFDAIIDGTCVENAKPDPEVFLKGAQALSLRPDECMVFEDSFAGIQAAKNGGMYAVGVGSPDDLPGADLYITSLKDMLVI